MKSTLLKFLKKLGRLCYYILPYERKEFFRLKSYHLYSAWIKNSFNEIGLNFYVEPVQRIQGGRYIEIGENFYSLKGLRLEAIDSFNGKLYKPFISIGDNVTINFNLHIGCINSVRIGNNVLIGSNVLITDHNHGNPKNLIVESPPSKRDLYSKGKVEIGDNVWIGDFVSILPGVSLGNNVVVGCNSVVTKSFPDNSVIGGVPAKEIIKWK